MLSKTSAVLDRGSRSDQTPTTTAPFLGWLPTDLYLATVQKKTAESLEWKQSAVSVAAKLECKQSLRLKSALYNQGQKEKTATKRNY